MGICLSKTEIRSFVGNVLPVWVKADVDLSGKNVQWHCSGDVVRIRSFADDEEFPFSDGVLLTLMKPGDAELTCTCGSTVLRCAVHAAARRTAQPDDLLKPYPADLHIHTSLDHNHDSFAQKQIETPEECIVSTFASHAVRCSVLTDHAGVSNSKYFFRCFTAEEETPHDGLVVFPGAESEVTLIEKDRFGIPHKNSGEIVTLNASAQSNRYCWEDFFDDLKDSPFMIGILAHPMTVGWDENGIWNFNLCQNGTKPAFKRMIRLVESVVNPDDESSVVFHRTYSQALDMGLRVSPCATSDSHAAYRSVTRKTFLLSPENSKEMFYDAIMNNRVYASESGDVDLRLTVNGCLMGSDLPPTDRYRFHVEAASIGNLPESRPVAVRVFSDYGALLHTAPLDGAADFELVSTTARYFYVEVMDELHRRTYSAPVWTGRAFDDCSVLQRLKPIPKDNCSAADAETGEDLSVLINSDPREAYFFDRDHAAVVIDLNEEQTVAAVGHYAPIVIRSRENKGEVLQKAVDRFASTYRISVSRDNAVYTPVKEGLLRAFGGEELLPFAPQTARYVKFEIFSTVGNDSMLDNHKADLAVAELSVFAIE